MSQLRQWEMQHDADLRAKEADEIAKKSAFKNCAAEALQAWYEQRRQDMAKQRQTNRAHESAFQIASEEAALASQGRNNAWECVAELVDISAQAPTSSGSADGTTRDTSRMRALLIQLKSDPPHPVF